MKRENIVFIVGLISILIGSIISVSAVTYLYNSSEVSYDNTNSGISATNVQGAINELYDAAQDYSSMNTRVTGLEGYFQGTTTSYFTNSSLLVGRNQAASTQSFVQLYYGGDNRGGLFSGSSAVTLAGRNGTSGSWGSGQVNIRGTTIDIGASSGTTVKINGTDWDDIGTKIDYTPSAFSLTSGTSVQSLGSITLSPGAWIISYTIRFASNADGRRYINLYQDAELTNSLGIYSEDSGNAVNGMYTFLKGTVIISYGTNNRTFYFGGYQNSGKSLSTTVRAYAVRVK